MTQKENSIMFPKHKKETMRNKVYRYKKDRNKNNWIIWVPRTKGTKQNKTNIPQV